MVHFHPAARCKLRYKAAGRPLPGVKRPVSSSSRAASPVSEVAAASGGAFLLAYGVNLPGTMPRPGRGMHVCTLRHPSSNAFRSLRPAALCEVEEQGVAALSMHRLGAAHSNVLSFARALRALRASAPECHAAADQPPRRA